MMTCPQSPAQFINFSQEKGIVSQFPLSVCQRKTKQRHEDAANLGTIQMYLGCGEIKTTFMLTSVQELFTGDIYHII